MHPEAKDILENLIKHNEKLKLEFEATHKLKNDPRITKIGKFLRKSSIDELPQLINVVRGEMSVIGPRPHAVEHNDYYRKYIRGYMQRHFFKPGITGLAQINGSVSYTHLTLPTSG